MDELSLRHLLAIVVIVVQYSVELLRRHSFDLLLDVSTITSVVWLTSSWSPATVLANKFQSSDSLTDRCLILCFGELSECALSSFIFVGQLTSRKGSKWLSRFGCPSSTVPWKLPFLAINPSALCTNFPIPYDPIPLFV